MAATLLLLTSFLAIFVTQGAKADKPPHILFIIADDMGWADVSWKNPKLHTPVLNKFAQQGKILDQAYVQPFCSPSRSAFLTGLYPFRMGLQHYAMRNDEAAHLPLDKTTLPEALKAQGYATHLVGKWHLGYCNVSMTPTHRGFDSFYGFYTGWTDYFTHVSGGVWVSKYYGMDFRDNLEPVRDQNGTYNTIAHTKRAQKIIREHDQDKPLFLVFAPESVHEPLQVPKVYEDTYCADIADAMLKTKCGMLAAMDEAIGNITGELENRGFMDNLLLVFTTDNGGVQKEASYNYPLRGGKATLWEGGSRAISFVYSKTLLHNQGTTHDGMIHAVDWYPTFLEAAGAPIRE